MDSASLDDFLALAAATTNPARWITDATRDLPRVDARAVEGLHIGGNVVEKVHAMPLDGYLTGIPEPA